ncbi:rCG41402, isoform CRA_a [Rattus norvegicus]|uniref:RCG41402, isoform CRA_a n=1 Tax=Rattus norvegicus TaxID=10116 RepID=A6IH70_RAT|nr:rCG41402, isoform CRA_a [Rattus norvegicus]
MNGERGRAKGWAGCGTLTVYTGYRHVIMNLHRPAGHWSCQQSVMPGSGAHGSLLPSAEPLASDCFCEGEMSSVMYALPSLQAHKTATLNFQKHCKNGHHN